MTFTPSYSPRLTHPVLLTPSRTSKTHLQHLRSVSSATSLRDDFDSAGACHPSALPRALVVCSSHSVSRPSMDPSPLQSQKQSTPRSSFIPSEPPSLNGSSRTSKHSVNGRVSSLRKSQGSSSKHSSRHHINISPTKTIVPPTLVTDGPILKRTTTTTNDSQTNIPARPSASSVSNSSSLPRLTVRPARTGSSGSIDLI